MSGTNPLSLIQQQVRALFTLDEVGQLHLIADTDEDGRTPAPRFFMGRTVEGNVWHFRHDLTETLKVELDRLCSTEPSLASGQDEPQIVITVRELLGSSKGDRGPAYWLRESHRAARNAVTVDPPNSHWLLPHYPRTAERVQSGEGGSVAAVLVDGVAVSVCSCVRLTNEVAEAGVHTMDDFRGHGYALAAVAHWSDLVSQDGRLPLYSTSWDNTASQKVAHKLKAVFYGEDWSVT